MSQVLYKYVNQFFYLIFYFYKMSIKKITKSKSEEKLDIDEAPIKEETKPEEKEEKRGRKTKYANDEERKEARRQQQRAYRLRKKQELAALKEQTKK